METSSIQRAAEAIHNATALVLTAGAGMGVDSGLPDFRGDQGFWRAYPAYQTLGLSFGDLANPKWFVANPALAWGFYGHRMHLYRDTQPHPGFSLLLAWSRRMRDGCRVFTSNVDGQFLKAGFDPATIQECHGSIHHLQCVAECGVGIFEACEVNVAVDPLTFRAAPPLPACPRCGAMARPNVLMFGDWQWDDARSEAQTALFQAWQHSTLEASRHRLVVVECGAGVAIPTVRHFGETMVRRFGGTLVRINVRDPQVPTGQVSLPMGAKDALAAIDALLR